MSLQRATVSIDRQVAVLFLQGLSLRASEICILLKCSPKLGQLVLEFSGVMLMPAGRR
jgi:hypothetical protein